MKRILFLLLFPFSLSGQGIEADTVKLKASLSITGFLQGGNVQTIIFRTKADVDYRPNANWKLETKNSYVYQEFGKEKADEDILSLNFVNYKPQNKFYPFGLAFISTNFRREIDYRTLVGGGFTYQILNSKTDWLRFSLSSEYEHTVFNEIDFNIEEYDGNTEINTFRGTLWVSGKYQLFEKKLILSHESFFQPSIEEGDNYRWQADISVELPIFKHLNFKINYLHTFESIVIENQDREDRFLTFGFTLKSY